MTIYAVYGITPLDMLDVHLVAEKQKPSALITIDPTITISGREIASPEHIANLESLLNELPLVAKGEPQVIKSRTMPERQYHNFFLGQNRTMLNFLKEAYERGDDKAFGLALGYPFATVDAYVENQRDSISSSAKHTLQVWRARQQGIKLPDWLAFITYVPTNMDILADQVPEEIEAEGKMREEYANTFYPALAKEIRNFHAQEHQLTAEQVKVLQSFAE